MENIIETLNKTSKKITTFFEQEMKTNETPFFYLIMFILMK